LEKKGSESKSIHAGHRGVRVGEIFLQGDREQPRVGILGRSLVFAKKKKKRGSRRDECLDISGEQIVQRNVEARTWDKADNVAFLRESKGKWNCLFKNQQRGIEGHKGKDLEKKIRLYRGESGKPRSGKTSLHSWST